MPHLTYFLQECPTCGRGLKVRVEHLGRTVNCQHCSGELIATDPSSTELESPTNVSAQLLRRAEELLQLTAPPKESVQ
ncbi:MAG: hypothetical protein N2C14_10290 [Planctomycetales bacterium]